MVASTADGRTAQGVPSDDLLMEQVVAGDDGAFRVLADRHLGRLLRLAQRLLGDAALADDVAQEALVRLWSQADRWQPERSRLTTWLHAIVYRLCIDRLRDRGQWSSEEVSPERTSPDPGALELLSSEAELRELADAVRSLPARPRAALTLHYYEGLSGQAAAEVMGIGLRAYWSLLHRAREAVRQHLRCRDPREEDA